MGVERLNRAASLSSGYGVAQTSPVDAIKENIFNAFDLGEAVTVKCSPKLLSKAKKQNAIYVECFKAEIGFDRFRSAWDVFFLSYKTVQPWRQSSKTYSRTYREEELSLYIELTGTVGLVFITKKAL